MPEITIKLPIGTDEHAQIHLGDAVVDFLISRGHRVGHVYPPIPDNGSITATSADITGDIEVQTFCGMTSSAVDRMNDLMVIRERCSKEQAILLIPSVQFSTLYDSEHHPSAGRTSIYLLDYFTADHVDYNGTISRLINLTLQSNTPWKFFNTALDEFGIAAPGTLPTVVHLYHWPTDKFYVITAQGIFSEYSPSDWYRKYLQINLEDYDVPVPGGDMTMAHYFCNRMKG